MKVVKISILLFLLSCISLSSPAQETLHAYLEAIHSRMISAGKY